MEENLDNHEYSETNGINCEICNIKFPCLKELHKHQSILHVSTRGYKCSICSFVAQTPKQLKHHQQKHEIGAKFQCEICHQICLCKSQLLRHIRYRHTNEKPYKCKHCPYASVEQHKLEDHLKVHAGVLNFQCKTCNKSFRNKSSLNRHEIIHKDSMEWVCILCFGAVKAGGNLCSHMFVVHHVENFHREGPHTSKENGLPETLKLYIDTLGLTEEDVVKDHVVRYYSILPEYSHCYSDHFKNVSPIICRMESERKGIPFLEKTTRKMYNESKISMFLQDLRNNKKAIPKMTTVKQNKTNVHKTATNKPSSVKDFSEKHGHNNRQNVDRPVVDEGRKAVQEETGVYDKQTNSVIDNSEKCEKRNRPKVDRPAVDEEEEAVEAILEKNIETATACSTEKPVSEKNNCIRLVSESENKNKRMNLLAGMKLGEFGCKPHVIKVLADGTILDCTDYYMMYLP